VDDVVTLLHGFTLGGESWDDLLTDMPEEWRWIAPDLRGHGDAPVADCTMDRCAADLVELWDVLGVERSHVVGYSMGGRLALHVAVRLPERTRSLLTIGAHAGLEGAAREDRRRRDEELADRIESAGIETFMHYWESLPMFASIARRGPAFLARLHEIRTRNTAEGLAASLRGMGAGAMQPLWDELASIRVPATFVAGDNDFPYIDWALRMADRVPDWRLRTVPDSGHAAQFEQPAATAQILADHLRWATAAGSTSTTD
jgi:2-succinyl-6-hydroxy-2,4-cyclohexadiene-1-carboxylate synthase